MSEPDEILPSQALDLPSRSRLISTSEPQVLGDQIENPASPPSLQVDHVFNFQIVVFQVENTLFQVIRNGFNVPGTSYKAIFALPQTPMNSVEGSSLENPIHLPGIKAVHFRSFLRILYPFIDQTPVVEFDEWVGVLNLATKWPFQEIRARAISKLSGLIKQKTVMERIALAREYQVVEWLRDAYLELTQKISLGFEKLQPAEPYSNLLDRNWEADAKKWEATSRDWETLARIFYLKEKVAASITSFAGRRYHCNECDMDYGSYNPNHSPAADACLCKCRLLAMVDEAFRGELEGYPGYVKHPHPPDSTNVALPIVEFGNSKKRKKW